MYRISLFFAGTAAALLLGGCNQDRTTDLQDSLIGNSVEDRIAGYAVFNPDEGMLPYPNNILFAPNDSSTNDYDGAQTLNIPYEPTDADANVKRQLNTLSGFSTISPITAPVTVQLDPASFASGVHLYRVSIDPATGAVTGIDGVLQYGQDFAVAQSGNSLVIIPLRPLEGMTNYMAVLTDDLSDADGKVLAPDLATTLTLQGNSVQPGNGLDEATAAKLEAIRQGNQAMLSALAGAGIDPEGTVQIWAFRTQRIGAVQQSIAAAAAASDSAGLSLQKMGLTTKLLFTTLGLDTSALIGNADIYVGTLSNLPQYMPQASQQNPAPVLSGEFSYAPGSFMPVIEANVTVPAVATVPDATSGCTMPEAGWPVVIYQHGIVRNRTDLFVYGETLAAKCYAGVAIDLPLHGVTESNTLINPFYMGEIERTFNLDIVTEDGDGNIIAYTPDGVIDSSGVHYMNLANILTTRDNMQQTTSDLFYLQNALAAATGVKFDPERVAFLSHSLGTMASVGYLNHAQELTAAVLAMPGQGIIQLLNHSSVFAPPIEAGLAAQGIIKGTAAYESFLVAAQTLIDDADPANYSISIGNGTLPILEIEAVGDGTEGSGDQHIPNSIATAPLSGTEPFIFFTRAQPLDTGAMVATPYGDLFFPQSSKTVTRLTAGEHRSPLDPQYSLAAFEEIHTELISFLDANGTAIAVTYPDIIRQ